jgi:hypothetical protein
MCMQVCLYSHVGTRYVTTGARSGRFDVMSTQIFLTFRTCQTCGSSEDNKRRANLLKSFSRHKQSSFWGEEIARWNESRVGLKEIRLREIVGFKETNSVTLSLCSGCDTAHSAQHAVNHGTIYLDCKGRVPALYWVRWPGSREAFTYDYFWYRAFVSRRRIKVEKGVNNKISIRRSSSSLAFYLVPVWHFGRRVHLVL